MNKDIIDSPIPQQVFLNLNNTKKIGIAWLALSILLLYTASNEIYYDAHPLLNHAYMAPLRILYAIWIIGFISLYISCSFFIYKTVHKIKIAVH